MRKNAYATIKWSHLHKLTDDLSIQSRISECFVNATVFIRVSTHANVFSRISGRVLIALVTDFEGATIFYCICGCFPHMRFSICIIVFRICRMQLFFSSIRINAENMRILSAYATFFKTHVCDRPNFFI